MPRKISEGEKNYVMHLLTAQNEDGEYVYGQRELERETEMSRPYIRKLAKLAGRKFMRNGVEIVGQLCMCANCGTFFRRPKSKVDRAKRQFCDEQCRLDFSKGVFHSNWKHGGSAKSFSKWVSSQSEYDTWKNSVLERDGYKCVISGETKDLEAHHIYLKSVNPEKAFDISNGITVSLKVHDEIHSLIAQGVDFEDAVAQIKEKYKKEKK